MTGGSEKMKYSKPIMSRSELIKMGFPREYLDRAYRSKANNFASKMNPTARNSPILFDTELFEVWRQREIKAQKGG